MKIALVLSFVVSVIGYLSTNSTIYGFCNEASYACRENLNTLGDPLFYGFGALAIVFAILIFVPKAYSAWKEFAVWFLPLAVLIFATYRDVGGFGNFLPHSESVFRFLAGAYIIGSIIAIGAGLMQKKGKTGIENKTRFSPSNPLLRLAWYLYIALLVVYAIARYLTS